MLDIEGEKSVRDEGDSAWLDSGVFGWSSLHSCTATQVRVVLTRRGSAAFRSGRHGPFRMGKLLDLKLSGCMYWSWSSRISRDSDVSLPVSSLSDEVMAQLKMWLPSTAGCETVRKLVPHEDKVELLQGWVVEQRLPSL